MIRSLPRVTLISVFSLGLGALAWLVLVPLLLSHVPETLFIGDYVKESDKPLALALGGDVFSMWGATPTPLMMPLALVSRLPALFLADLFGLISSHIPASTRGPDGQMADLIVNRYAIGTIFTVALAAALNVFAADRLTRGARWGLVGALIVGATLALNPLSIQALIWGHPEEVLLSGLILAALIAVIGERWTLSAVLVGLAVATKQPAILVIGAFLIATPQGARLRSLVITLATAAIASLPFVVANLGAFIEINLHAGSSLNGYYDIKPFNFFDLVGLEQLDELGRLIIYGIAIGLPLLISWRRGWKPIGAAQLSLLTAFILLARCYFDPYNIVYYAAPVIAAVIGYELATRESLAPSRWLAKRGIAYLPIISLPLAFLLEAVTGGAITVWAEHYLSGKDRMVYGLVVAVILAVLLVGALGLKVSLNRSRAALYGSAALIASILIILVPILYSPQSEELVVSQPGFGYEIVPLDELAADAKPDRVYELASTPAGTELRFSARPSEGKWAHSKVIGMLDYGPSDDPSAGVTVSSYAPGSYVKPIKGYIKMCSKTPECHPEDEEGTSVTASTVSTKVGPALVYEFSDGSLEAKVITKRDQMIYLIATGADQRDYIETGLETLKRIPARGADQAR